MPRRQTWCRGQRGALACPPRSHTAPHQGVQPTPSGLCSCRALSLRISLPGAHITPGYSTENGGVSWPVPWVAKRPHILNAPTAARAVVPPGVVPVGQSMPRPSPGMIASVLTTYIRWSRWYAPPQSALVSCRDVPQSVGIVPPDTCVSFCYTSEEVAGRRLVFLRRGRPREPKGPEGRAPSPRVEGARADVT